MKDKIFYICSDIDLSKQPIGQEYYQYLDRFRGDLLRSLSIIKNPFFKEECEWRIISHEFKGYQDIKIKFREGKTMMVPYIRIRYQKSL